MGARPMARVIQDNPQKPLAKMMLFWRFEKGGTAKVDIDEAGELELDHGAVAAI